MSDPSAPQNPPELNSYGQPDAQSQYAQPQYAQPQYADPQYADPQYADPQYADPQYAQAQQNAPDPAAPAPTAANPSGVSGMFQDPSTLAATGLLLAVTLAIVSGVFNFLGDPGFGSGLRERLLALTATVDVGQVALIGVAVALLLLTPDPPGGIARETLLKVAAVLGAIIAGYGILRAGVGLFIDESILFMIARFIFTLGIAFAAATVAFYAAKESILHKEGRI